MKTFVFTNRVYPPVAGATGELLKELAEGLAVEGARVVVVTSRGPASLKLPQREVINGVEILRVGTLPFTRASHLWRAVSYLGLYPQLMWQVRKLGRVDAVVSMTDPPLQVAAVTLASSQAKKRIHWAQDLYPELAEELGLLGKNGLVARALRAVSNWALRRQDKIVAVGRCMRERLVARGLDAGKIEVIPNWSSLMSPAPAQVQAMRKQLGWDGKFIALYSGNVGLAHEFETIVGAAKLLAGSGVQFVIAGEGPRLNEVKTATEGMTHVHLLPPQPKDDLSGFLAAADIHLVSVRSGLEGLVVPSKAYAILAAGRPIIYVGGANSEIAKVIAETGCGMFVPNGDKSGLAKAISLAASQGIKFQAIATAATADAVASWRKLLGSDLCLKSSF